jgi:hypothetical protein
MLPTNTAFLKLSKRAETYNRDHLIQSFVDVGPLFTLLSNPDNQILYGRRGTGKTHILAYLVNEVSKSGRVAVQIDMRTLGSTGGIYSDSRLPVAERATRLLADTLVGIHDEILGEVVENAEEYDLSRVGPLLDRFAKAATEVVVEGTIQTELQEEVACAQSERVRGGAALSTSALSSSLEFTTEDRSLHSELSKIQRAGTERLRVHFGAVGNELQKVIESLPQRQLWIILDEWSEIPLDLQPYLADLLRRTILPLRGVTVKIAAIEQRCRFRISEPSTGHIGIEIGADAAVSIHLDEFLVFDNNAELAKNFFRELLYKHIMALAADQPNFPSYRSSSHFVNETFTQLNAFDEFVRSSEGVPRDAINIIGIAAQKALDNQISVPDIRSAALTWYQRAKQQAVTARPNAQELLTWIIDEVIRHRQARAFLLSNEIRDDLIEFLYDSRVLHIVKQGISAQDMPGKRFNVYSLDYGCYVDLINTVREPKGLLEVESESGAEFIEVPQTDFRSIRRSILDLQQFYEVHSRPPSNPALQRMPNARC